MKRHLSSFWKGEHEVLVVRRVVRLEVFLSAHVESYKDIHGFGFRLSVAAVVCF